MGEKSGNHGGSREAQAGDHKSLYNDEHLVEEAKGQVASTPHNQQQMIPKAGTNPALRDLQARRTRSSTSDETP